VDRPFPDALTKEKEGKTMNMIKLISCCLMTAMISGCASTSGVSGPRGPKVVASGYSTEYEQYAEVGIQFSSVGDFFAFVSPSRWSSPMETGGSLSWLNPEAWNEDAGRTGRVLIGEVVVVGGVVAAAVGGGGGGGGSGGGSDSGSSTPSSGGGGSTPTVPSL
jgi:hypothetical protein